MINDSGHCVSQSKLPTWLRFPDFSFGGYSAGLFCMSARSFAAYVRMFLNRGAPILQPRSIAAMKIIVGGGLLPLYDTKERFSQNGLSWYWDYMNDGRRYIDHNGSMLGMMHLMLVNEKNTVGAIILTNGDINAPTDLSKEIAETVQNIYRVFR